MKAQQMFDKELKNKLMDFEMEPPAGLFDKIAAQSPAPAKGILPWYMRPNFQRAAAVVTLLLVAGTIVTSQWLQSNQLGSNTPVAAYDSLRQSAATEQLLAYEEVARLAQEAPTSTDQPASTIARYEVQDATNNALEVTWSGASEAAERATLALQPMTARTLEGLPAKRRALNASFELRSAEAFPAMAVETEDAVPAWRKTYGLMQEGGLFALAKERFDEFRTKEHYVSFNLGSLELGQTIQLSKPQN